MGVGEGKGQGCGGGCSEGCVKCCRVMLLIFNSLFLIIGVAILGMGIWFAVDPNIVQLLNVAGGLTQGSGVIRVVSYVFLATGVALMLVSIFGLAGASRWSECLLATYIALCVILLAFQLAVFVMAFVSQRFLGDSLKDGLTEFITDDYDGSDNLLSNGFRRMQANLKCCGVNGASDWVNLNTRWYRTNGTLTGWRWPQQCCALTDHNNPNSPPVDTGLCRQGVDPYYSTRGCHNELYYFLRRISLGIGGGVVGLFVLQLLIITLASVMHVAVKRGDYGMDGKVV